MRLFGSGGDAAPVLLTIAESASLDPIDGMFSTLLQVIAGGLLLGAVYALFSSGLTLVWGMMNIINFAHGDFVMIGTHEIPVSEHYKDHLRRILNIVPE